MSLTVDAIPYIRRSVNKIVKQLNFDILRQIEDDLDIDEKISILFLITEDYANAFKDIIDLLQKKTENAYIITNYVKNCPKNWKDKVLEALCVLNNREVIRRLNIAFDELDVYYVPMIGSCSKSINVIAKCLYKLCESLDESEQKLLLSYVQSEISNYDSLLDNVNYLELHMLYWMQIGYITISKDEKPKIKNLLKHFSEKFENSKMICLCLEKFENSLNVVDTHCAFRTNDKNNLQSISLEEQSLTEGYFYNDKKLINSGLCIIINQMNFEKEYETRFGTNADCTNLSNTFQNFGFKIVIYEDLKREEMLEKMKNITKDHGNNYDCLFLCILSHGYKGGVITTDEKEISLDVIEKAVCCMELQDVIKVVLIQACQGKIHGSINNCLAIDSLSDPEPTSEDIRKFANFLIFMSTMQGFLSIRHKEKGSWFIQEVCNVLGKYGNQLTFFECVRKIMISVQEKKGILDGNRVAQLPEKRTDRLYLDFQLKSKSN